MRRMYLLISENPLTIERRRSPIPRRQSTSFPRHNVAIAAVSPFPRLSRSSAMTGPISARCRDADLADDIDDAGREACVRSTADDTIVCYHEALRSCCCGVAVLRCIYVGCSAPSTPLHCDPPEPASYAHSIHEYAVWNAINVPRDGLQGGDRYIHPSGCDDNSCARGADAEMA